MNRRLKHAASSEELLDQISLAGLIACADAYDRGYQVGWSRDEQHRGRNPYRQIIEEQS